MEAGFRSFDDDDEGVVKVVRVVAEPALPVEPGGGFISQVEDVVQGKGVAPLVIRAWHSTVRSLISWAAWAYFPARLSKMTPV